jgi:hypothetical protein
MNLDVNQQRLEAHLLIDQLPGEHLTAVHNLLALLVEPLSVSLAKAPFEEEELSEETIAAIERGRLCFERGEYTSHEDMLREFAV